MKVIVGNEEAISRLIAEEFIQTIHAKPHAVLGFICHRHFSFESLRRFDSGQPRRESDLSRMQQLQSR